MKLLFRLLLTIVFAVTLFAHPFTGTDLDATLVHNTTSDSTHRGHDPQTKFFNYEELMSGPEPISPYANLSVPVTAGTGAEGKYTADIRMSGHGTMQHVAQLSGQRMWDVMRKCLLEICPYERGSIGCWENMPGTGSPNKDGSNDHKYYSKCIIEGIPYKGSKGGYYETNAWLTIKARAIYRNNKYPGLGAATYEMAAGVYARMTENPLNCYPVTFTTNSRIYQFCNVPKHVLVAFPTTGPVIDAWLSMEVEFNGKSDTGTLNCSGSKAGVTAFWETAVRPDAARLLGYPEDQWGTRTTCENDLRCFDVNTWRGCKQGIFDDDRQ